MKYEKKIDLLSLCIVGKGAKEWKWACLESGLPECKLVTLVKTHFASKVAMFHQCLACRAIIIMCYGHQIEALANKIPSMQTWAIVEAICDVLSLVVTTCVVNQHHGYWLLSNVFASTIKLYVRFTKEKLELQVEVDAFEDMDMHPKVKKLGANMREQVALVLRPFLDFMDCFKHSEAHNMVVLMLDPRFKDLSLMGNYVGHTFVIGIVAAYVENLSSLPSRLCIKNTMDGQMLLHLLCKKLCAIQMLFLE